MAWLNLIHANYCLLTIEDTYYKTHFHLIYAAYLFLKIFLVSNRLKIWPCLNLVVCIRTALSEFGTYRLCEQRRFRRACASAQSRQNLRCSLIQAVSQEEPSDRKPDPWPLWMAGHAQLKFVMTECSKTQIRLTGLIIAELHRRTSGNTAIMTIKIQALRPFSRVVLYSHRIGGNLKLLRESTNADRKRLKKSVFDCKLFAI